MVRRSESWYFPAGTTMLIVGRRAGRCAPRRAGHQGRLADFRHPPPGFARRFDGHLADFRHGRHDRSYRDAPPTRQPSAAPGWHIVASGLPLFLGFPTIGWHIWASVTIDRHAADAERVGAGRGSPRMAAGLSPDVGGPKSRFEGRQRANSEPGQAVSGDQARDVDDLAI